MALSLITRSLASALFFLLCVASIVFLVLFLVLFLVAVPCVVLCAVPCFVPCAVPCVVLCCLLFVPDVFRFRIRLVLRIYSWPCSVFFVPQLPPEGELLPCACRSFYFFRVGESGGLARLPCQAGLVAEMFGDGCLVRRAWVRRSL